MRLKRRLELLRAAGVAAITLVCTPTPGAGQINIEQMRQESPDEGLSARVSLSLSTRSGNVDVTNLEIGGRAGYTRARRTVFLAFAGDYGWQDGEQFSDQGLAHVRYVHGVTAKLAGEVFAQTDYNGARRLDARALAGLGVRVDLLSAERIGASLGMSIMFEHEELDLTAGDTHPRETDVNRWNSYVGFRWAINDNARLSLTGYAQPQLDDFGNVRAIANGAMDAKLGGPVSLSVTFRLRHDSEPPQGIESTDTRLGTGLTVAF